MDNGIPYTHDAETRRTADYIRWALKERKKASIAEFQRRCEECRRLAMDATPMGEGERAMVMRELQGKRNGG